jgi:hypothetical protein
MIIHYNVNDIMNCSKEMGKLEDVKLEEYTEEIHKLIANNGVTLYEYEAVELSKELATLLFDNNKNVSDYMNK